MAVVAALAVVAIVVVVAIVGVVSAGVVVIIVVIVTVMAVGAVGALVIVVAIVPISYGRCGYHGRRLCCDGLLCANCTVQIISCGWPHADCFASCDCCKNAPGQRSFR